MLLRRIFLASFLSSVVCCTASAQAETPAAADNQSAYSNRSHLDAILSGQAPRSVSDLAASLLDAVVNISTTQTVETSEQGENIPTPKVPENSPFGKYFEEFFKNNNSANKNFTRKVQSLGSGFVIDAKKGYIVTNNHVVDNADEIEAIFTDGTKLKAKLLGKDTKTDLALLQVGVGTKQLKDVQFGDSNTAHIGDWVMAVGNPFGFGGSVTVGIISARNRDIDAGPYDDFIQTDAAINRGNSGGPLFDMTGKVIGINTAIVSPSGGSIGIGFAIPSDLAIGVIDQLKTFGKTRRGWLGIRIEPVTQEIADNLHLKTTQGALVAGKIKDSHVDNSALQMGDVILRFNDKPIKEARDLPRIVAESPANQFVNLTVLRDGSEKTINVKLGLLEEKEASDENEKSDNKSQTKPQDQLTMLGMKLEQLTGELRKNFQIPSELSGLLITDIVPNSKADRKHLQRGDVIVSIEQEKVTTVQEARKRLDDLRGKGRKSILLVVANPTGELRLVTLEL